MNHRCGCIRRRGCWRRPRLRAVGATRTRVHAIAEYIRQFINLYGPHAAREDAVLFPAIKSVIPVKELTDIGDRFEDKEEQFFGKGGLEKMVAKVADIKKLGIYELSRGRLGGEKSI